MDDELQWVEGEFMALEALRQGGEDWLFPIPPRSFDGALPDVEELVPTSRLRPPYSKENGNGSSPPPTKIFVD